MTDFKVGDKVRILNTDWTGKTGKVVSANSNTDFWPYRVRIAGGQSCPFGGHELELVKPEPKFAVGDWVKVHGRNDKWDGSVCVVTKLEYVADTFGPLYLVNIETGPETGSANFFECDLEAYSHGIGFYPSGTEISIKDVTVDGVKIPDTDPVNNPSHYTQYPVEVIELTRHMPFDEGNVVKYVARAPFKGNRVQDLKKARWYLDDAIKQAELEEAK